MALSTYSKDRFQVSAIVYRSQIGRSTKIYLSDYCYYRHWRHRLHFRYQNVYQCKEFWIDPAFLLRKQRLRQFR